MEEDRVILALLSEVDLAPGKVLSAQMEWEAPAFKFQQLDLQVLPTYGLNICCGALSGAESFLISNGHHLAPDSIELLTGQLLLLCHPMSKGFAEHGELLRQERCKWMGLKHRFFFSRQNSCMSRAERTRLVFGLKQKRSWAHWCCTGGCESVWAQGGAAALSNGTTAVSFTSLGKSWQYPEGDKKRDCDFWPQPKLPAQVPGRIPFSKGIFHSPEGHPETGANMQIFHGGVWWEVFSAVAKRGMLWGAVCPSL